MKERLFLQDKNKGSVRSSLEKLNYHFSNLSWRIDLAAIPFFIITGNPLAATLAAGAYWWDRRSIRNYKKDNNIPLEPVNNWWDKLNPHKGHNRFSASTQSLVNATA